MTPTTLNDFIGRLVEIGLVAQSKAIGAKTLSRGVNSIEVGDTGKTASFSSGYENSLQHYIDIFSEGKYSLLMYDGSMLFIKYNYSLQDGDIIWHRYGFLPAVIELDIARGEGPDELPSIEDYISISRKGFMRFEYDRDEESEDHPKAHMHFNYSHCRLPLCSKLGVSEFIHFVIDMFYPKYLDSYKSILPARLKYTNDILGRDELRYRISAPIQR